MDEISDCPYPFGTYLKELTSDLIVIFDGDRELLKCNERFLHLSELGESELRNKKVEVGGIIKVEHLWTCLFGKNEKNFDQKESHDNYEKRESFRKRKRVNYLYFEHSYDYSKREIARMEDVSTDFVVKWTQSPDQDFKVDNRGWKKGRPRKWGSMLKERIKTIRQKLEDDPEQFYVGPTAVQIEYHRRYPEEELPPVRTIGKTLSDLDLTKDQSKSRNKGAAKYLRYPEETIYGAIGNRVLEADFVGEKYITGRTEPINFIGYSFKKEPRLRYFQRVKGETTDEFINQTQSFFTRFEEPDVVKVDNAMAMIGGGRGKRALSRTMIFLLRNQVYPVYSVPRKPFTQASIEGSNSVFARKFWNRFEFGSLKEIDRRLESFNESSRKYTQYKPPESNTTNIDGFEPKVYFTRQVKQSEKDSKGEVNILNETIKLPTDYVKYFVLGEWRLRNERLLVRFEKEEEGSTVIKSVDFPINERSKEKCPELLNG